MTVFPKWSHIESIVWSEPYHSMEFPEWLNTTGSGMLYHSTEVRPWPVPIKCTRGQRSNQCDFSNSKSKEEEVPRSGLSRLELVSAFKRSVKWIRDLPWIRVKRRHRPLFCINLFVFWPLMIDPTLIGLKWQITHSRRLWQLNWWSAYLICFLMPLECLKKSERSGPLVSDRSEEIQGRVESAY